jgi:ubiquinone biosynthesis protein UbiJ
MFNAEQSKGMDARIGFRIGEETFLAHLANGRIEMARGPLDEADLILTGTPPVLAGAIYGGQPLEMLEQAGVLRVEGDRALARRFMSLFPLPSKVSKPV